MQIRATTLFTSISHFLIFRRVFSHFFDGGLYALVLFAVIFDVLVCWSASNPESSSLPQHYTNTWVSEIQGESYAVHKILQRRGYIILDEIFANTYHLHHPAVKSRSLAKERYYTGQLEAHPQVVYVQQQVAKKRSKRDVITLSFPSSNSKSRWQNKSDSRASASVVSDPDAFLQRKFLVANPFPKNDPQWRQMWYLNRGSDRDLKVYGAWESGYSGLGIVVSIIDDGLEKDHPDLVANYDPQASYDMNGNDDDPSPRYDYSNTNRHGTRCAGEVAAVANNHMCGVGVAFRASIGGIRMLDGDVSDAIEARALSFNNQHIDVYSVSWGPDDDGMTVDGPAPLTERAFIQGVTKGRGGRGSIFVWASGNGGRYSDNCNCDGYTNSIFTLSVSSATQSDKVPWYSESCAATLATTYSGGSTWEAQISTIDLHYECTSNHSGTSASAPLAAGIVALTLEANTELTWRDVQHIVVATARPKRLKALDWKTNGAGRKVSHSFGFGLMDAGAMVQLARKWKNVAPQLKYETYPASIDISNGTIPPEDSKIFETFVAHAQANKINSLEHVQVRISLAAKRRGDLKIALISANSTRSVLLTNREADHSSEGFADWTMMTVHCWGESPHGMWQLEISNDGHSYGNYIYVVYVHITRITISQTRTLDAHSVRYRRQSHCQDDQ
ncbi:furin-like protease 1 isoform X2 [Planococcus citri]|uniref:furin-like protease 1 isoform X2 n=1 Tax=Planococcus citri TaxID=170843 RepID=UPI0031F824A7